MDAGRNYIRENNIPTGFAFSDDGRVFVSLKRRRTGIYATLAYFSLSDIRDGRCPPLKPYPSYDDNSVDATCCNLRNLVSVDRFNVDECNRLWVVDTNALDLNDKSWELGSPKLVIYNLKDDSIDREVLIPSEYYFRYKLGLTTVVINVDPRYCGKAFAYIIDTYNGCIIVYSYEENKFWKVCSPEFYSDAKYSKFTLQTRQYKEVTYYKDELIFDCTRDLDKQQVVCHSSASLDEWTLPFEHLNNEAVARCSPNSLDVKFLGQKCKNCQTGTHVLNRKNRVVWGVQELNYGVGCWNLDNQLNPDSCVNVVSSLKKLPFPVDLQTTQQDLMSYSGYSSNNNYGADETYVVVLTNNRKGIEEHGFNADEENFALYFFKESEALYAYPQCLAQQYSKPYQPAAYQPAPYQPAPYQPAPYKQANPTYKPVAPVYKPAPYQPAPYQPAPYQSAPTYKPVAPVYKPQPYNNPPAYAPAMPAPYQAQAAYQPPAPTPRYQYRRKKSASEEASDAVAAESKQE